MALAIERTDQETLGALGRQCALLLREGDIDAVAQLFGYAMAFDRPPSLAIAADLQLAMVEAGATRLAPDIEAQLTVKRLKPRQFLLAIVECRLPTTAGSNVLVELAVTTSDGEVFVCLEQVSATA